MTIGMLHAFTPETEALVALSARVGRDPLLVQAASGNTSIKLGDTLWVKASGKWLAHAEREDILVPISLTETRRRIAANVDPAGQVVTRGCYQLGTSVETAMHAVIPHRVVVHVHSVNTIALAVRRDGPVEIAARLRGMDWAWVPYVPSGLALARGVEQALAGSPGANVLVLGNHGLVVAADTCDEAERLLCEVECRVASVVRLAPEPDIVALHGLASAAGDWRVPHSRTLHEMATDATSLRTLCGGVLYPCQAIFLTVSAPRLPEDADPADLRKVADPFALIEGVGMLVREQLRPAEAATLEGLAQVLRRISGAAPVRYLNSEEVGDLLCADVYRYRARAEGSSSPAPVFAPRPQSGLQPIAP